MLCVAGILLRSYRNKRCDEKKVYEPINGDVKDHESIDGSIDSVKMDHCNFALLSGKNNRKDYQTIR